MARHDSCTNLSIISIFTSILVHVSRVGIVLLISGEHRSMQKRSLVRVAIFNIRFIMVPPFLSFFITIKSSDLFV